MASKLSLTAYERQQRQTVRNFAFIFTVYFIIRFRNLPSDFGIDMTQQYFVPEAIVVLNAAIIFVTGFVFLRFVFPIRGLPDDEESDRVRSTVKIFGRGAALLVFLSGTFTALHLFTITAPNNTWSIIDGIVHLVILLLIFKIVPEEGSFSVTAPNGKVYTFPNQAALDAFKKKAGIP